MGFVLKILALKFKYLGDVAIMVPALRALNERWPSAQLDVLVANEAVPILSELPWVHKVWGFHRSRGSASIRSSLPLILALRKQNFDRSVDFVGNDRGAILSWCIGAQRRLGPKVPLGFAAYALRSVNGPADPDVFHSLQEVTQAWQPTQTLRSMTSASCFL